MIFKDAAVHDHFESGRASFCRGGLMDDPLLHPYGSCADSNRGVHKLRHELRPAKNIDNIDVLRHLSKRGVHCLAQYLCLKRIDAE